MHGACVKEMRPLPAPCPAGAVLDIAGGRSYKSTMLKGPDSLIRGRTATWMFAIAAVGLVVRLAFQAVIGYEAPPVADALQYDNVRGAFPRVVISSRSGAIAPAARPATLSFSPGSMRSSATACFRQGGAIPAGRRHLRTSVPRQPSLRRDHRRSRRVDCPCPRTPSIGHGDVYTSEPLCAFLVVWWPWLLLRLENCGMGCLAGWASPVA
jgi:hypothetical protein